jgi:serine/threonine-protein kinase
MRIGQYEVHEAIASGGMASVHFGRFAGPGGFARSVAIKRMHAHLVSDPEFVAMFVDEARLAARVHHPNVVATLDVLAGSAELLIVMEYVHGEPLARLVSRVLERRGRIPPAIACAIVCDLLAGLHAAHEATDERGESLGLVHRDVSPENVLVGLDGAARVLDFGVAKAIGRLQVTRDGQVKGKIAYMAPEQVRGTTVDRKTDVYAASVVLWELLAGRRLFEQAPDGKLVERILFGNIDAPSAVAPHVPELLNAIVLRGLARDPADRFATARDLARGIREAVRPASASEVTDWVEAHAAATLGARAETLAAIDRDREHGARDGSRDPDGAASAGAHADRLAVVLHTDLESTKTAPVLPDRPHREAWTRRAATIVVVVAIGGAGVRVAGYGRGRSASALPDIQPAVATATGAIAAPVVSTDAPSTSGPDRAAESPVRAARLEGDVPPPLRSTASPRPPPRKRAAAPSLPSPEAPPDCSPPYTTDADGTRLYKLRCL